MLCQNKAGLVRHITTKHVGDPTATPLFLKEPTVITRTYLAGCGKLFPDVHEGEKHLVKAHSDNQLIVILRSDGSNCPHRCPTCGSRFRLPSSLNGHIKRRHRRDG